MNTFLELKIHTEPKKKQFSGTEKLHIFLMASSGSEREGALNFSEVGKILAQDEEVAQIADKTRT